MIATIKQGSLESPAFREARDEDINFLLSIYQRQAGSAATSALDIACGLGDYASHLADRNLRVVGLENDPYLLDMARKTSSLKDGSLRWNLGDLRHFAVDPAVDLAVCMRGRISQLLSNEDLIRHFNAVANALAPGGLYVIELPHPRFTPLVGQTPQVTIVEKQGVSITRTWPLGAVNRDFIGAVITADEEVAITENGGTTLMRSAAARRMFSPQDLQLLAIESGSMRVIDFFGAFDLSQPLDSSPHSQRMIAVLQKVDIPLSYLSPKLTVQPSKEKGDGFGVFARQKITTGELLVAYGGHTITRDQLQILKHDPHRYSLQIEEDLFLSSKGALADYVNHSCDPNAGMYGATMLTAMREIAPGEEICWDYAMSDGSPYDEFDCTCGAPGCRLKVTGNDWQIPALWSRYAGYFSPYLQRRIDRLRAQRSTEGSSGP